MMKKITTVEELMEILENGEYSCYGLRNATEHDIEVIESGRTYLDCSHDWIDNEETGEDLPGSCAVYVGDDMDAAEIARRYAQCSRSYYGNTILLIADNHYEWGNDENEVILGSNGYGADVIAAIEL